MGKYRKKPVIIEAHQWFKNGDHPDDYSKDHEGLENGEMRTFPAAERREKGWEGDVVRYFRRPDIDGESICSECGGRFHEHGWIDTLEDGHRVCPGDWIITGVKGERYPCKPDIFKETYEVVEEDKQEKYEWEDHSSFANLVNVKTGAIIVSVKKLSSRSWYVDCSDFLIRILRVNDPDPKPKIQRLKRRYVEKEDAMKVVIDLLDDILKYENT